jgi:hypothetical protein
VTTDDPDGWGQLRNQDFWPKVKDHGFWRALQVEFERIPYGMKADLGGIHDPSRPNSPSLLGLQLSRDIFTELAWRAVSKLCEFGLQSSSDPVEIWLDLLKSNGKMARTLVGIGFVQTMPPQATEIRCVECIRSISVALCSTLATQALKNDMLSEQGQVDTVPLRSSKRQHSGPCRIECKVKSSTPQCRTGR